MSFLSTGPTETGVDVPEADLETAAEPLAGLDFAAAAMENREESGGSWW